MEQTAVTLGRNGTDHAEQLVGWTNDEEAETDDGRCLESAERKIGVRSPDDVVKAGNLLVELSADAANEPVAKRRHPAHQDCGARLAASVRLWEWRQRDIALGHGLRSASEYSGSSSP